MTPTIAEQNDTKVQLALKKIGQAFCRHSFVLIQLRNPSKLFLRCYSCGAETDGFVIGGRQDTHRKDQT